MGINASTALRGVVLASIAIAEAVANSSGAQSEKATMTCVNGVFKTLGSVDSMVIQSKCVHQRFLVTR